MAAILLTTLTATSSGEPCPKSCNCRWKSGKQTVECRSARLRIVPTDLDPGTQVLDLSNNELHALPAEVFRRAGLVNLQKIYLSNCRIRSIDDSAFAGLTNLVDLDLSGNTLTGVPSRALRSVPALRELKLTNNPVQRIDADTFSAVPGLVKLDLSDCQILEIEPAAFDALTILESLKISGNRLQALRERTVVALRRVHNVELHANPWECDCQLRPMREWLQRNNIPYPIAPSCHGPERVAGKTFEEMSADDFACPPQLLPMVREVATTAEHNVTLTCRVGAIPQPQVSWFWRGRRIDNNTQLDGGPRVRIVEEGGFERVSRLVIAGVREEDASADYHCVAVNRAGDAETNFTLTVGAPLTQLAPLEAGQIAGIVVGLILALVVTITLVFLLLKRLRHPRVDEDDPKTKPPHPTGTGGVVNVEIAPDDDINPVQKPPRLTEIGYNRYGVGGPLATPPQPPPAHVRAPDLINEIDGRRVPAPGYAPEYGAVEYGVAPTAYGSVAAPYPPPRGVVNPLADDSYELQQLPSTSGSDPERTDPAVYGYPADFGLPMPELGESPYGPAPPRPEPPLSASSGETPLDSSRDSRGGVGDLSTSHDSAGSGARRRLWEVGVPVLPPLPPPSKAGGRVGDPAGTDV